MSNEFIAISDPKIAEMLRHPTRPQEECKPLVELALHHGGKDNVTVALAEPRRLAAN